MEQDITRRSFIGALAAVGAASAALVAGCSSGAAAGSSASPEAAVASTQANANEGGNVLFVNPSQNRDGNTARMAADLLEGIEYETLNLVDCKVHPLGADFPDDQFEEVWQRMCEADFLVWGTPVYWHTMSGALKVVVDRMYDKRGGELQGKPFAFFQQGGSPTEQALASSETIIGRVAELYGLDLVGTSDSAAEIPALREAIMARLG